MLSKADLTDLGIVPGPIFAKIFKAIKPCKTKDEALAIATAMRDGTFQAPEHRTRVIDPDSCLHWFIENRKLFPCAEFTIAGDPSISQIRRMLEQGAVTLNGRKPKLDDLMEFPIWELVFFKGAKSQCTLVFDMEKAPVGATWMNFQQRLEKGLWVTTGTTWHTKQ